MLRRKPHAWHSPQSESENWLTTLTTLATATAYFTAYFAALIWLFTLVVAPLISLARFGYLALPTWVTPMKLLLAPLLCAATFVLIMFIATLLGFRPEDSHTKR